MNNILVIANNINVGVNNILVIANNIVVGVNNILVIANDIVVIVNFRKNNKGDTLLKGVVHSSPFYEQPEQP